LPLSFINKNIFITRILISLSLRLLISFLKRNLKRGLIVTYLEVGGLKIKILFNKNIIKLKNNKEYIKEAVNIIMILCVKQRYNYKDNMLVYFKVFLN